MTPKLYHELLEQTQTAQIPSLREKKYHLYFQCVYYEGKWSSKLRLSDHRFKGCEFGLIHTYTKNRIPLPIFPNMHFAQTFKFMKRTMENNITFFLPFKLRTQLEINVK